MPFVNDLENQVRDYLEGDYEIIETNNIPSVDNVSLQKKAIKMKLCAYSIDLRKSSDLLFKHQKQTSGKIHKTFLTIASKVVSQYGGEIRSFQGDCILVFWPANSKSELTNAVKAAMVTTWMLDIKFSKYFESYEKLDFGIGIDWSEVYILRAGISRNANNNDLVFIGKCVNFATAIAEQFKGPYHIGISLDVYNNLEEEFKYHYNPANNVREDMWENGKVNWNDMSHDCKITHYCWSLD